MELANLFTNTDSKNNKKKSKKINTNNSNNNTNEINNMINHRNSELPLPTNYMSSPSLIQGTDYKKYQNKVHNKLQKHLEQNEENVYFKEGFQDNKNDDNNLVKKLTKETKHVLESTDIASQVLSIDQLKEQYNNAILEYETLMEQLSDNTTSYISRVNPNNPYLNKTIRFTTGHIAYVTNQGAVKYIPTWEIWNSVSAPKDYIQVDIPWNNSWNNNIGLTVPTNPPLISGTFMQQGQSLGNEGINVFVNNLINNPSATYGGCFADNVESPLMEFIGGSPPPPTTLQNGNFSTPQISSNSYISSLAVPGWTFLNAVLVNNSSAWGYPTPYPTGNQCVSIQMTNSMYQTIYCQTGVTYQLSFVACGRNCCDGSGQANIIVISLVNPQNNSSQFVFEFQPPVSSWTTYSTSFTVNTSQYYNLAFSGTWSAGDRSVAIQNIVLNTGGGGQSSGSYTYTQCQDAAIDNGYKYFALQGVNPSTSKGYCAISNSEPTATSLGEGYVPSGQYALWWSGTYGQPGNAATLTNQGSLAVYAGNQLMFHTDYSNSQPSNYLGTYQDCVGGCQNRAMFLFNGGSQQYNYQQCQWIATVLNFPYFALQNSSSGTNAQCALSANFSQASQWGPASNQTAVNGYISGGGASNSVYNTKNPSSNYFLILQDDGNLCIYRGTGPTDNQGYIWCAGSNGKQQQSNPAYTAAKGKNGQNWISDGTILYPGEFIGSTTGNMALIMQTDGNLVLYTFTNVLNCQKMSDGNMGAGAGSNALYELNSLGVPSNVGGIAYIDENSELHAYPRSNSRYMNGYTSIENTDSSGYDIPYQAYGNATVDQCRATCDSEEQCAGFAYGDNTCWPKTSGMYPNGQRQFNTNRTIYIKNKGPQYTPIGVKSTTSNIDSVAYQNYINGGGVDTSYGLAHLTAAQRQELEQLQQRINTLASQLSDRNVTLNNDNSIVTDQTLKNMKGLDNYTSNLVNTKKKIQRFGTKNNVDNILEDSDITVLQQNYNYLFWSILATGTILVSMKVLK